MTLQNVAEFALTPVLQPVIDIDLGDTLNSAAGWTPYGDNTVEQDGDAIKITRNTGLSLGAFCYMRASGGLYVDPVVGQPYTYTGLAKVETTPVDMRFNDGSTYQPDITIGTTSWTRFRFRIVCQNASNVLAVFSMGSGEVIYLKDLKFG